MIVLVSGFLMTSCGSSIEVVEEQLEPCAKPSLTGETWADLAEGYLRRGQAIDNCNDRILGRVQDE